MPNLFQKAAEQEQMPGEDPAAKPGAAQPVGPEDDGGDPNPKDPNYLKAKELAMSKLYEEGAAQQIGMALQKAPSLLQGLVEQSLVLFSSVDEATGGTVPDNLLLLLGLDMLSEVAEIANAAGLPVDSTTVASAVQKFILAVVEDMGGDTAEVEQAMSQIDPAQVGSAFDKSQAQPAKG